jgi:ABC-2 type transport system ATP-binding protein
MPDDGRIAVANLTKYFGKVRAVDDLSFEVEPGTVTGFLGPNGAGKTTTLRCLLGLVAPTKGTATIGGRRYADLADPLGSVGAALEASSFHPGRTARNHLRVLCAAARLPDRRADEVLQLTGLGDAANRRVRGFSMGMRQRLALAATLLGDPRVLILDEPANGLDPAGINWLREFLRYLATRQGKTVLVSSHILSEVEQTVDSVVIIAQGRLIREGTLRTCSAPPAWRSACAPRRRTSFARCWGAAGCGPSPATTGPCWCPAPPPRPSGTWRS